MTFPTIIDRTIGTSGHGSSSKPVTMPASITVGDMLIVFGGTIDQISGGGVLAITKSGAADGWTEFFNTSGSIERLVGWYKIATSSSESFTFFYGQTGVDFVTGCIQIRGASNVESNQAIGGPSTSDPPLLVPTGGTQDYLWLAVALCPTDRHQADGTTPQPPANYANIQVANGVDSDGNLDFVAATASDLGPALSYCDRSLRADQEDPGTFTQDNANNNDVTSTIAIWSPPSAGTNQEKAFFGAPLF